MNIHVLLDFAFPVFIRYISIHERRKNLKLQRYVS